MERVAARFQAGYPADLQQPLFFPNGDRRLSIRLPRTHDVNHDRDGDINLRDLSVRFNICTLWPEQNQGRDSVWEKHRFNLDSPEGWEQMLQVFPQRVRKERSEGESMKRHLRRLLTSIPAHRRDDPEYQKAIQAIHDAAHSRPGDELTPEQVNAIQRALNTTLHHAPVPREQAREIGRMLRAAGLETVPSEAP